MKTWPDFAASYLCGGSRTQLTLGGDVRQGKSDRPTSIRLLNLSIYMYIHIHEPLDHALLAMHLVLLENRNLRPPPATDREGLLCPSDKGLAGPGTKSSS